MMSYSQRLHRGGGGVRIVSAEEAVALVRDLDNVVFGGSHAIPERLIVALEARFLADGSPRGITMIAVETPGDTRSTGATRLAHPGLIGRAIAGGFVDSPAIEALVREDRIEGYNLPQGVLSQLFRDMAAGRPGLITHVGLNTFVDPRLGGGRQNSSSRAELVEVVTLRGREWLLYHALPVDIAFLRGSTADEDGNISFEQEANYGEGLAMAQATRQAGGIVVVQVRRIAKRCTIPAKSVRIPGVFVDFVVVDPDQRQTYVHAYNPAYAGEIRVPLDDIQPLPFSARKVIARRAAMELYPGAVCNLGVGVSTGIAVVAAEEDILDDVVLTNEQGLYGGAPASGVDAGAAMNYMAMIDQPSQFDFYDGGGLDLAFLSFAQADRAGNVNVSRFGDRVVGIGGFMNISQNARRVVFSSTFTAAGLDVGWEDGSIQIRREGREHKFVDRVTQLTYSGAYGRSRDQTVLFVTERAVFRGGPDGPELIEVAPGLDPERHLFPLMGFRPSVAADLREMDPRLFRPEPMGIAVEIRGRPRSWRAKRLAELGAQVS
jgi:propionate CoA-transferase